MKKIVHPIIKQHPWVSGLAKKEAKTRATSYFEMML